LVEFRGNGIMEHISSVLSISGFSLFGFITFRSLRAYLLISRVDAASFYAKSLDGDGRNLSSEKGLSDFVLVHGFLPALLRLYPNDTAEVVR